MKKYLHKLWSIPSKTLHKVMPVTNKGLQQRDRKPKQGLVLAAGGTRTTFQIGALCYLYDVAKISPQVISGCSAGSVLATILAQSKDPKVQRQYLSMLSQRWQGVQNASEVYEELEWFNHLKQRAPHWFNLLQEVNGNKTAAENLSKEKDNEQYTQDDGNEITGEQEELKTETTFLNNSQTQITNSQEKIAQVEDLELSKDAATWSTLSLFKAMFSIGVTQIGDDIATLVRGVTVDRSLCKPGPFPLQLLEDEVLNAELVKNSGVKLRIAVTALESGKLRYVTEKGVLLERDGKTVKNSKRVDIKIAVQASCAIPAVFRPYKLDAEHYVDGGVREKIPTKVVVEDLGAQEVWCVATTLPQLAKTSSYAQADLVSVLLRSGFHIMDDEIIYDELNYAKAVGAKIVFPEFDVHGSMEVNPGITKIFMDYGWARAAEVHVKASRSEQKATLAWVKARKAAWELEEEIFKPREKENNSSLLYWWNSSTILETPIPTATQIEKLLLAKQKVYRAVKKTPFHLLPPDSHLWHMQFESHNFDIDFSFPV